MKQLSRAEFEALFGSGGSGVISPDRTTTWTGQAAEPFYADSYRQYVTDPVAYNHDIAYALSRQQGLSHEASVQAAQQMLNRRVSQLVGREDAYNSMVARMPLQSPLPEREEPPAARQPIGNRKPRNEADRLERERLLELIIKAANDFEVPTSGPVYALPPEVNTPPPPEERYPIVVAPRMVDDAADGEPPRSRSGRRMAMRWGLPAAGVGLGLYALSGLGANSQQSQEPAYVQ